MKKNDNNDPREIWDLSLREIEIPWKLDWMCNIYSVWILLANRLGKNAVASSKSDTLDLFSITSISLYVSCLNFP